jgi:uncharacterized membrane protein
MLIYTMKQFNHYSKEHQNMQDQRKLISTAITGLLALGLGASSGAASALDNERCFGIAKAGQNACNSNANKHSCAGHSKIDNDPNDYASVPKGSCLKVGGKLEPGANRPTLSEKN